MSGRSRMDVITTPCAYWVSVIKYHIFIRNQQSKAYSELQTRKSASRKNAKHAWFLVKPIKSRLSVSRGTKTINSQWIEI